MAVSTPLSAIITGIGSIFIFGLVWVYKKWFTVTNNSGLPLPPGPKAEPFFGHFRTVPLANPEFKYIEWGKQYSEPVVVLNSVQAASDLMSKRGSNYQDRPRFVLFEVSLQEREARTACLEIIKSPERWEIITRRFSSAIVLSIGFGVTIDSNDHPYLKLAEDANFATTNGGSPASTLVDYFPIFKYCPGWLSNSSPLRHARDWKFAIQNLHEIPFAKVQEEMRDGVAQDSLTKMLLEKYHENEQAGIANELTKEDIKGACGAIFIAGANTTWSTIMICILNLLMNPEVLQKAKAEVDKVVGSERLPNFGDRSQLRYIDFIVQEAFRWAPLSPVGIPHRSIKDDTYEGMFSPAGTVVYANARAMCYDEATYKGPSVFNPDRFTPTAEGGAGEPFAQGPFGFGRRTCPGKGLAAASIFIMLATMLATLELCPKKDGNGNEIKPKVGLSNGLSSHPDHFEVSFKPRTCRAQELLGHA